MDLVNFSEDKFNQIKGEIEYLASKSDYQNQSITFIPISALHGDNVVKKSQKTDWYKGKSLLDHLESLNAENMQNISKVRFPVQNVIRPKTEEYHDFRGYAGKLYGGDLAVGDQVTILPSSTTSTIKSIHFFDKEYEVAKRGSSISITLEDDVNISRGDMIVKTGEEPEVVKEIEATLCWMDNTPLQASEKYYIKHGVNDAQVKIVNISSTIETDFSGKRDSSNTLTLNEIGEVSLKVSKPLFVDSYETNKENGAFILVNPKTNNTAGVGFIK